MSAAGHLAVSSLRHRPKAAMAGIVVVLALASFAIVTGLQVGRGSPRILDDLAAQANVADLVVGSVDPEVLRDVAAEPAIDQVAGPLRIGFPALTSADADAVTVRIVATGTEPPAVGVPVLRAGRWLRGDSEVVLDRSTADAYGARLGGTVTLAGAARTRTFTVVGLAIDLTDCAVPQCTPGRGFVTDADLDAVVGGEQWWMLLATVDPGVDSDRLGADIDQRYGSRLTGIDTWPDTRGDLLTIDRIFSAFLSGFGGFLLVATAVVLAGSTAARMVQRRREVAITKTLGATGGQLVWAFVAEQLVLAAVGVVLGWIGGSLLAPLLQVGLSKAVGRSSASFELFHLGVAALVVGVVVTASVVVPSLRAARIPTVAALRDDAHPTSRLAAWAGRLPRPNLALGLADLVARPLRTALAVLVASVAVIGTLVSTAFLSTMTRVSSEPRLAGDPWDVSVVADPANASAIEAVLDGSSAVAAWFTETSDRAAVGDHPILARAIGGPYDGARYEIGEGRPIASPDEALVGHPLLDALGIAVGDEVTFVRSGVPVTVTVVGWYRETEDSGEVLVHRIEALEVAGLGTVANVWLALGADGIERATLASELSAELGGLATVREIELDTDLAAFRVAMVVIAALVIVVATLHLAATWLTSSRERAREVGALRTLGCTDGQLTVQHALAGTAVAVGACLVGVPVGIVVNRFLGDLVTVSIGAGPGLTGRPSVLAVTATVVACVAVAAGLSALIARRLIAQPTPVLVRYE